MLSEQIAELRTIFNELQSTNSITEKKWIIYKIPAFVRDDFMYIVECLNGKHKFGYNYYNALDVMSDVDTIVDDSWTIKQVLQFLRTPMLDKDLSHSNISKFVNQTKQWWDFLQPIVDRELKLGIGNSLFEKSNLSPMLAKKFEGTIRNDVNGYYITEKLDGNRCIAHYSVEDGRWHFTSRNGKEMHVNFNMSGLPTDYIYDGEVLSPTQVELSKNIYDLSSNANVKGNFNATSGIINSHAQNKNLIYNIFDCVDLEDVEKSYRLRREFLDKYANKVGSDIRILPVLHYYNAKDKLESDIYNVLEYVVGKNGEGIMINLASAIYEHKRTDSLLKFKKVQTMDMKVIDVEYGTGKYEGQIGSLICQIITDKGLQICCKVGSGLSDYQRWSWAENPYQIIGKIVEVGYFSMSQDKNAYGTNVWSLRFPRLKQIRNDKNTTSEY